MVSAADFRRVALSLAGAVAAPHFDRTAFKVVRTFATLSADGLTANLKFTPDEQDLKCLIAPDLFQAVPNAWGKQGWTTVTLGRMSGAELSSALELAWRHAIEKKKPPKRGN